MSLYWIGYQYAIANETSRRMNCQKLQRVWDWPYLQVNLVLIDASTRNKTLGSQMKDSLLFTPIAVARESAYFWCLFPEPQFLQGNSKKARWYLHMQWVVFQKGTWIFYNEQEACLPFALEEIVCREETPRQFTI